ncbi:LysR family transcriptional regulator [Niveibacterium sp. 24ML]|uniref:LysR family transcriptional regulator n=1 Tax=Niveibacterium sp. 24ML TaxID=2985512 RepID=UPI0022717E3C|nr:LysR family transcriptional regulator [Niveibacterium sp. 24ML]MCX9156649.1 LysR family transcriptional regulator [Niveibacterium sp. 24ML]
MSKKMALGQISDLEIRLLRVFKTVAECGGLAAAELELNIGVSTVSRHIKDLEERLGLILCHRGRGGFALTAEGQQVYDDALRLLAALDAFRSGVEEIHQRMTGSIAIALFDKIATNPAAHVSEALGAFAERAPDVAIELHVAPLNAIERGVMDGQFQVGIAPMHRQSASLDYLELFPERMYLYCGRGHDLFHASDESLDWPCVRQQRYAGLGYHSPNMEMSHEAKLKRAASAYDQEAVAMLVQSGRYIGFLPDHYAESFERAGQMRRLRPALLTYDVNFAALVRHAPRPSRVTQTFLDCLTEAHTDVAKAS